MPPGLLSVFTEVSGIFCLRLQFLPLERLDNAAEFKLKSVQILVFVSLWELQPGTEFSIWISFQGKDANRIFCIDMQILQRNECLSELPLCCCWGSGGWKNELCVHKAAGTRVSPKCRCLGVCKAINASFFLLQLLETPIFSIDFTQNAYCPWRCDLYLRLIYFCHGCSIFERAAGVGERTMNSTWNINPKSVAFRHSSTYLAPFSHLTFCTVFH